jgi:O-antigen ligase
LFGVVAANGAAFAFFGIAQQLVWNGQIYGRVPLTQGGRPFAAFVNSNNAGGYLNLCLAAGIGFAMYAFSHSGPTASGATGRTGNWFRHAFEYLGNEISQLNWQKLASLVMLTLIFAGLLCTLSRGSWCALLVSIVVVIAILAANKRAAYVAGTLVLVVALGFGLVDWLGRTNSIGERWESLQTQLTNPSDGRLAHWPDGVRAASNFWFLGSGFGTYRYVYRPYATTDNVWFYHAENQYIEALCEGGILGLGLMLAAIATMAFACQTLLRDRNQARRICGIVGTYALVSQVVHSLFDFGLYLPANMALFALICGAVAGASAWPVRAPDYRRAFVSNLSSRKDLQATIATLLFCAVLLGVTDLDRCSAVETALEVSSDRERSVASVTSQILALSSALEKTPSHAEAQYDLAQLWVHRYRLRSMEQLARLAPKGTSNDELWPLTLPIVVHGTIYRYLQQGRTIELENLRRSEPVQTDLANAARALLRATRSCALLPRSHLLLAEIAPILSQDAATVSWLSSVPFLSGGNTKLLKECAIAQMQAGQIQDALATLRRLVELSPAQLLEALQLAALVAEPAVIVQEIAPSSPHLLVQVAGSDYVKNDDRLRLALLSRATELMRYAGLDPADYCQLEASIHILMQRDEQAIDSLQKAVAARPEEASWRYELAILLQKQGDVQHALEHARVCAGIDPSNEQFGALFRQLNRSKPR